MFKPEQVEPEIKQKTKNEKQGQHFSSIHSGIN